MIAAQKNDWQCQAKTKSGRQCRNNRGKNSLYCTIHAGKIKEAQAAKEEYNVTVDYFNQISSRLKYIAGIATMIAGAITVIQLVTGFFNISISHYFENLRSINNYFIPWLFLVVVTSISATIILLRLPNELPSTESTLGPDIVEGLMREPLHETTRKTRRNLLLASLVGFAMTLGGIAPKKVDQLGIEAKDIDANSLLILTFSIVIYFLISFCLYVRNDIVNYAIKTPYMVDYVKSNLLVRIYFEAGLPLLIGALSLTFLFKQVWF